MEYFTADTYKNAERIGEPFEKEGRLYSHIKIKCDRCYNGTYVCRVENNQPVPHPAYGGVCLKCGGTGYLKKDVRLYTEKEYIAMTKAKEKAKEKKMAEQEEKMRKTFSLNRDNWLLKNGFNSEGYTYIISGETFSIKDKLKAAGLRYDSVFSWHGTDIPEEYKDRAVLFHCDELVEFSAWGEGHYLTGCRDIIKDKIAKEKGEEEDNSNWVGQIGDKLKIDVTLSSKTGYFSRFGWTNIYYFLDAEGNQLVWFTSSVDLNDIEINTPLFITGTVKKHDVYKNKKQTILTRCKIKEIKADE